MPALVLVCRQAELGWIALGTIISSIANEECNSNSMLVSMFLYTLLMGVFQTYMYHESVGCDWMYIACSNKLDLWQEKKSWPALGLNQGPQNDDKTQKSTHARSHYTKSQFLFPSLFLPLTSCWFKVSVSRHDTEVQSHSSSANLQKTFCLFGLFRLPTSRQVSWSLRIFRIDVHSHTFYIFSSYNPFHTSYFSQDI